MEIVIPASVDFSFLETVSAHGWRRLQPFKWDDDTQTLCRAEVFGNGSVAALEISAHADGVQVHADTDCDRAEVTARVTTMLQLDLPLAEFHAYCRAVPVLASLAECRRGRLLRSPTLWEDTVKVIATTNTTWAQTIAMTARLVREFGTESRAYPTPAQIAAVPFDEFAAKARHGLPRRLCSCDCDGGCRRPLGLGSLANRKSADGRSAKAPLIPAGHRALRRSLFDALSRQARPRQFRLRRPRRSRRRNWAAPSRTKKFMRSSRLTGEWRGLVYNFYPWKQE